jgi:hypothetical protein
MVGTRTRWRDARLERLFERYNRLYWRGRLARHRVVISAIEGPAQGQWIPRQRLIQIDLDKHRSDREVRSTLLHEMAHAAARSQGHDVIFFAQVERLLRSGAPIAAGAPEAGHLVWRVANVVPRRFPLLRARMERAEREHARILGSLIAKRRHDFHRVTWEEILARFSDLDVAKETWQIARRSMGVRFALTDEAGRALSQSAARFLVQAEQVHRRARRGLLEERRRRPAAQSHTIAGTS